MKLIGRTELSKILLYLVWLPVVLNCRTMPSQAANNNAWSNSIAMPVPVVANVAAGEPELPRFYLDTTYVPPTKAPKLVAAGDNLQAAINAAQPGDVLALQAGATFTGNFTLPAKSGSDWIIIRSSAPDNALPPPGSRISPSFANVMPKIVAPNDISALTATDGAHHYRFIGVEITIASNVERNNNLVTLGDRQTSLAQLPHDLIFDRVFIHGNESATVRRGVALNSASTAIIDSYISDCHEAGQESQAIAGWNGPGPFKIVNNYLEGAGVNILIGGADPTIPNLVPSDIEFQRNYCFKPTSWKVDEPDYAGRHWTVKNHFELKNAQRVLVNGNLFENNWADAQVGFSILFTVRNQDGTAPWSVVQDVTFTNNIIRHSGSGLNMSGTDNNAASQPTRRVRVSNNLFDDINGPRWGGAGGRWLQFVLGPADVTIEHNTAFQTGLIAIADELPSSQGFVFRNNLVPHNEFGFFGSGIGTGNAALDYYFPGAVFIKNVIVGGPKDLYPADNFFPANLEAVGFVDFANKNYRLSSSSPFKKAGTDGRDVGVDFDLLNSSLNGLTSVASVSAASYFSDTLALESIAASFGTNMSGSTQVAVSTPLPTELGGTTVKVKDKFNVEWPCPLFFVSPTQINFQVPPVSALGSAEMTVFNGNVPVARGTIQVSAVSPGLFTANATGSGLPTAVVLRVRSNNTSQFEAIAQYDPGQNRFIPIPIDLGPVGDQVFLILYGTGIRYRGTLASVSVNIGGVENQVTFAAAQGGLIGLDQINVRLQRSLIGRGDVDVNLTVEGRAANRVQVNFK
jgi:uncharacterized protein (TIGR03437 family)